MISCFRHQINIIKINRRFSFFEGVGYPKYVSAPMVEHSGLAFRLLVRKHGVLLAYTPMIHSKMFINSDMFRAKTIDWSHHDDRPLIAQLNGNDIETIIKAASYFQDDVDAIDLNLGCPQNIAKRGNYGAFLLQDKPKVLNILSVICKEVKSPITAKIRIYDDMKETIEMCQAMEGCGISLLTVHGRTLQQKKQFVGKCNWDVIKEIKNALSIPVIANGGIGCYRDVEKCIRDTGVDGVMSSEALLENPRLFHETGDYQFRCHYVETQFSIALDYLEIAKRISEEASIRRIQGDISQKVLLEQEKETSKMLRNHMFKFLFRFLDAPNNNDIRSALGSCRPSQIESVVLTLLGRIESFGFVAHRPGGDPCGGGERGLALDHTADARAIELGLLSPRTWYDRYNSKARLNLLT